MGAMLSAGIALRWLRVPYLVGERSPLMDPKAQAGFIGMALRHGPKHFVRAVLEGVAFALRQIVDTMVDCGADLTRLVASGNGLANPVWGGTIEIAQRIAGHISPSTTRIYDRSGDQLTLQEIERVQIGKKHDIPLAI